MPNNDSHQHVVKTTAQWNERAIEYWVVPRGCLCVELTPQGKTKLKVGEGNKNFYQLPYICDHGDLSNYYTKEETDALLANLNRMAIVSTNEYDSKDDLPSTGNKLGDVRFVKSSTPDTDPDIYVWNGTKWISTGSEADVSDFVTRAEFNEVKDKVDEIYPKAHTHANKDILDGITQADRDKFDSLHNYDDTEIRQLIEETGHTHPNKALLDTITPSSLWSQVDRTKFNSLHNYDDTEVKFRLATVEEKAHTHANKSVLDGITQEKLDEIDELAATYVIVKRDILDLKEKAHTHDNKDILDGTTAAYTIDQQNELYRLSRITTFLGAGPTWDGIFGYVPAPISGQETYYLRGDGTWAKVKGGGDKYKAGEGITILSGEVISETFPFEIFPKAAQVTQYVIYGTASGVGNAVSGHYEVPIKVSAPGYSDRTQTISIADPLYDGDYIDYQRQVFAHYRTNICSRVSVDPNYNRKVAIYSDGHIGYLNPGAYGDDPGVSLPFEIIPGATYEIHPWDVSGSRLSDFRAGMYVNLYDADMNRTRTIFQEYQGNTIIVAASNEKYMRMTLQDLSPYWGPFYWGYQTIYQLYPVETPCQLNELILYPNVVNTVDVLTTNKPNEIYVEVDEPEEIDPDDPMSEYTGIIYNDGVLDITQEDPNNLNELTVHFRDNVDKTITIPASELPIASDTTLGGIKVGNNLTIDPVTGVLSATGGGNNYRAGDGIEITTIYPPQQGFQVENTNYYFDTNVQCTIGGRTFTKYTTDPALGVICHARVTSGGGQSTVYSGPMFFGLSEDAVKVHNDYSGGQTEGSMGTFEYKGYTWYISAHNYMNDGTTIVDGGIPRIDDLVFTFDGNGEIELGKMVIDLAGLITDPIDEFSAKLGNGLQFNTNDAIEVQPATTTTLGGIIVGDNLTIDQDGVLSASSGGSDYIAGDGINIERDTSGTTFDIDHIRHPEYFFETQVSCKMPHTSGSQTRIYTKLTNEKTLGAIVTHMLSGFQYPLSGPLFVSTIPTAVGYGTDFNTKTFEAAADTFEYLGYTWYYTDIGTSDGGYYMEYSGAASDMLGNMINLGTIYPDGTSIVSIAKDIIDAAGLITAPYEISAKLGDGLRFDTNRAIEAIPYVAGAGIDIESYASARLPVEYQEVEYIASDGVTQNYINTGIHQPMTVVLDMKYNTNATRQYMGWSESGANRYFGVDTYSKYNVEDTPGYVTGIDLDVTERRTITVSFRTGQASTMTIEGQTITNFTTEGSNVYTTNDFLLFTMDTTNYFSNATIYEVTIYDTNFQPIFHGIPCYRVSDDVSGLYDLVSETFKPSIGGNLAVGPDVVPSDSYKIINTGLLSVEQDSLDPSTLTFETVDGDIDITIPNTEYTEGTGIQIGGNIIYNRNRNIPSETYRQVEYLASDGTGYILTDIMPTYQTWYQFRYRASSDNTYPTGAVFGSTAIINGDYRNSHAFFDYYNGQLKACVFQGSDSAYGLYPSAEYQVLYQHDMVVNFASGGQNLYSLYTTDYIGNGRFNNDSLLQHVGTSNNTKGSTTQPLAIFAVNTYDVTNDVRTFENRRGGRFYYLNKMEGGLDDNLTTHYLLPCYRIADSVYGVYDIKHGVFYPVNDNTGFSVGNDLVDIVPVESNVISAKIGKGLTIEQTYGNITNAGVIDVKQDQSIPNKLTVKFVDSQKDIILPNGETYEEGDGIIFTTDLQGDTVINNTGILDVTQDYTERNKLTFSTMYGDFDITIPQLTYSGGEGITINGTTVINTGILSVTQDYTERNKLTFETVYGDIDIVIPTGDTNQYVKVSTDDSFLLLHTKPADWDDSWDRYFELTYDEITTAPMDWDPTRHYKYENDNYVLGTAGDSFVSTTWYDKHYVGLDPDTPVTFDSDVYYTGELQLIEDGETYDTAFAKINEAIEHIERLEQEVEFLHEDKIGVRTTVDPERIEFYNT